jgi:hypothetical protein
MTTMPEMIELTLKRQQCLTLKCTMWYYLFLKCYEVPGTS